MRPPSELDDNELGKLLRENRRRYEELKKESNYIYSIYKDLEEEAQRRTGMDRFTKESEGVK